MTLDQVREIATEMGLSPRRSQSIREISYAILDAQADKRAADVQAKEEARAAAGKPAKRERTRGVKLAAKKVSTTGMKSERVMATVGTEREQMAQIETAADPHKPNKTVQAVNPLLEVRSETTDVVRSEKSEEPVVEQPKKKRGRPKKSEEVKVKSEEVKATSEEPKEQPIEQVAEKPKKKGKKAKSEEAEAKSEEIGRAHV